MRFQNLRARAALVALALSMPAAAHAQTTEAAAIEARITTLEKRYAGVFSDIDCDAPTIRAHQLMCESSERSGLTLWRMGQLDDLAWAYAYENATKREIDQEHPPRDAAFIKARDACRDVACLRARLIAHTNASLGGESPYRQR